MAIVGQTSRNVSNAAAGGLKTTPENYTTLDSLLDPTKDDVRDLYVQTYGDQGITGFLSLTGAKKNAGTADQVDWYEEGRLHKTIAYTAVTAATTNEFAFLTVSAGVEAKVRLNDVLLLHDNRRYIVVKNNVSTKIHVVAMDGEAATAHVAVTETAAIIGNIYGQGTEQPTSFYDTGITKLSNPYIIVKEMYEVNGSQASNIGWLNVNGQYMWYLKNEMDARKRFMNEREMMLIYSELDAVGAAPSATTIDLGAAQGSMASLASGSVTGSEGYFQAVQRRGIVADVSGGSQSTFASMSDLDSIILELDKEGAPAEYALYLGRRASLDIDDMLASGIATQNTAGLAGQFGAFNNSPDMAVALGFKSFTRGGYTFHKHDWKLLNDANTGGLNVNAANQFKGAFIPMTQVADAQSGVKSPSLEMNYKSAGNYSREMEHWVEGGGVLGHVTSGKDTVKFNYRSECNLVTRAANQHVLIK
jgi:hypothetical protein